MGVCRPFQLLFILWSDLSISSPPPPNVIRGQYNFWMCGTFKKWQFSLFLFYGSFFFIKSKKSQSNSKHAQLYSFFESTFSAEKVRLRISFCTAVHSPVGASDFDRFHNSMSGTTFCNIINKLRLVYK